MEQHQFTNINIRMTYVMLVTIIKYMEGDTSFDVLKWGEYYKDCLKDDLKYFQEQLGLSDDEIQVTYPKSMGKGDAIS